MELQGLQMYLLVIVALLHQTVCFIESSDSEDSLIVDFESNLDSLDLNIKLTSKDMWHFWHFEYIQELDT